MFSRIGTLGGGGGGCLSWHIIHRIAIAKRLPVLDGRISTGRVVLASVASLRSPFLRARILSRSVLHQLVTPGIASVAGGGGAHPACTGNKRRPCAP